jgi:hypothetical protein
MWTVDRDMHQLYLLAATCLAPPFVASSYTRTPRLVIFCCRSELRTLADSRSADEMPASQKPRISASPTAVTPHQCALSSAAGQVLQAECVGGQCCSLLLMTPECRQHAGCRHTTPPLTRTIEGL